MQIPAGYAAEGRLLVKYQAAWSPTDAEVTVTRDVHAGVCGPAGTYPAATLAEAEAALFAAGYLPADTWQAPRYDGGAHWVLLTAFKG